jgi:hypothetical protein
LYADNTGMRIESSNVTLASTHQLTKVRERKQTLQVIKNEQANHSLCNKGLHSAKRHGHRHSAANDNSRPVDLKYHVLADLMQRITGKRPVMPDGSNVTGQASDVSSTPPDSTQSAGQSSELPAGWTVRYTVVDTYTEQEQTAFQAKGVVTANGKEINFSVSLAMGRSYTQSLSSQLWAGNSAEDPLPINPGQGTTTLSGNRIQFNINMDGNKEAMPFATQQSGFLVIDKNGNGVVDDGSEILGATTGDGFRELAAYDDDKNGWIDEGDAAYSQLRVWRQNGDQQTLDTLKSANIGAIYTGSVATPFEIKNDQNQTQAKIQRSGIYLAENGTPGTVQSIDIAV